MASWRLWPRKKDPPLRRGDVRWCDDPRNRSNGVGRPHKCVLLKVQPDGRWLCAVIESTPDKPVFTFTGSDFKNANLTNPGSGTQLPVGLAEPHRFKPKEGCFASPMACDRIEVALKNAQLEADQVCAESKSAVTGADDE